MRSGLFLKDHDRRLPLVCRQGAALKRLPLGAAKKCHKKRVSQ